MKKEGYRALKVFKALSNVVRYSIIQLLEKDNMEVGDIALKLSKSSQNISQHLKILKNLDIVGYYTQGNNVVCYLINKDICKIINLAENMFQRKIEENLESM